MYSTLLHVNAFYRQVCIRKGLKSAYLIPPRATKQSIKNKSTDSTESSAWSTMDFSVCRGPTVDSSELKSDRLKYTGKVK